MPNKAKILVSWCLSSTPSRESLYDPHRPEMYGPKLKVAIPAARLLPRNSLVFIFDFKVFPLLEIDHHELALHGNVVLTMRIIQMAKTVVVNELGL